MFWKPPSKQVIPNRVEILPVHLIFQSKNPIFDAVTFKRKVQIDLVINLPNGSLLKYNVMTPEIWKHLASERNEYVVKSILVSGQKYLFSFRVDNIVTSFLWQWCTTPDKVFTKIKTHKRSYEHNKHEVCKENEKFSLSKTCLIRLFTAKMYDDLTLKT